MPEMDSRTDSRIDEADIADIPMRKPAAKPAARNATQKAAVGKTVKQAQSRPDTAKGQATASRPDRAKKTSQPGK